MSKSRSAKPAANKQKEDELSARPDGFLVVGIGASAGGIQALREFFAHVPADSGMAYVVILHLSPDYDSKLTEVLQQVTGIAVEQVTEKVLVKPDHVYVVPPNQHLMMEDGYLAVVKNATIEDRRAPVDIFFRTLADSIYARSVGVVLSGTGANGSMGIKRIKERGGAAFVQNPREAEYNEMPRNSIATDLIDDILPVAQIPARIIAYKESLRTINIPETSELQPEDHQQALREIFTMLRTRSGHDFSNYKRPTLLRRIERRINVRNLPNLPAYAAFMRDNPDEAVALMKDMLISVTNFFRDKKAFEAVELEIIPLLQKQKQATGALRIWVVGCATGEEAYSLAMICAERTTGIIDAPKVQIFATDIDDAAINQAREGVYTINDAADVSPERLRRFFTKEGDSYRIKREIREMILFANHNILKDPPFSHLDLISCRNMLIYLNSVAQERAMETFHFALEPGGYLFLGTSESADNVSDLYAPVSREHHIYQSRAVPRRQYPVPDSIPNFRFEKAHGLDTSQETEKRALGRITYADLHQQLLEQYAPPSVVVNEEYEIVHLSDRAGRYLQVAGGEPSQNLLKLIRPELRLELRTALYQAVQRQAPVEAAGLKMIVDDLTETINIHIRPVFRQGDSANGFILVLFEQASDTHEAETPILLDVPVARQLEDELIRAKDRLRIAMEQHELKSEELKASNEELQAINEELRSASEELETSKEELQSINEELTTVNQELKVKVEEVSLSNNNLQNLINSTAIGTVFLDRSLRVALFTPAAREIFNLIPADYGRPLSDITNRLDYGSFREEAETVLEKLVTLEREVRTVDGRIYLMRVLPYRIEEDRINGVVLTFLDITSRKEAEQAIAGDLSATSLLHELGTRLSAESDIRTLYEEIMTAAMALAQGDAAIVEILDEDSQQLVLRAAHGLAQSIARPTRPSAELDTHTGSGGVNAGQRFINFDVPDHQDPEGTLRPFRDGGYHAAHSTPLVSRSGKLIGALTTYWNKQYKPSDRESRFLDLLARQAADLIEQRQSVEALRASESEFRTVADLVPELLWSNDAEGNMLWHNQRWLEYTGLRLENAEANGLLEVIHPDEREAFDRALEHSINKGESVRQEVRIRNGAGKHRWFLIQMQMLRDDAGEVSRWYGAATDIHEVRITLDALRENEERFRVLADTVPQVIWTNEPDGNATYFNKRWYDYSGLSYKDSLGPGWQAIVHSDDAAASVASWKDALATGRVFDAEYRLRRHDGVYRWFIGRNVPLRDKAGNVSGWFGTATDIEEVKQAQELLRESEERLRVTLESAIDYAIITTDTDSHIRGWSAGAERIFGYREDEVLGKSADLIFTPEDIAAGVPLWEMQTARKEGRAMDERWHQRRDGTRFFMSGVMAPIYNPSLIGYVKVARDMTDERRAADALRQAEERQRIVLEAAELGTWDWNIDTGAIVWNEQHYYLFGMRPSDRPLRFEDFTQYIHPDDLEAVNTRLRRAVEEPVVYQIEFRVKRADNGGTRWISGYGKATARNEHGRATRMTGVMYDITQRKETEQRKEEFLGVASHELKTPITSIKAYAELLQDMFQSVGHTEMAEVLTKLDNQVDRLTQLIRDLLDATRINEGRLELELASVDINEVVRDAVDDLQRTTQKHELKLELQPVPPVQVDHDRILQVLNNILSNAIKYSPAADTIVVRSYAKENHVYVCVQDFGVGLPEEATERIFERFFRAPDPAVRTFPGMGLGLYIAAEIVKQHNGRLWVESKKGKGSTFCFSLPLEA